MAKRIFITDKELAAVLEVSEKTIYRMLNGFYRRSRAKGGKPVDVTAMRPDVVCGVRRWRIHRVAAVLGVDEAEIQERIQ